MAKQSFPTLSYRIVSWAIYPIALAYTLFTAFKFKNSVYFFQRIGRYKKPTQAQYSIWCHCASVGEINTALPLLRELIIQGEQLLITTNTVTGYDTLTNAKLNNSEHVFLPLDYSRYAKRLLKTFQPKICLVFETELWPSILLATIDGNIHVAIINGRISEKTLKAPTFVLNNYKRILANVKKIISSSDENTSRFISLGANPEIVITLDNLKFANQILSDVNKDKRPLKHPYLLCASTHDDEEESIIKAWLKKPHPDLGLVIALRHPQRTQNVCNMLKQQNCSYCLHSASINNPTQDTIYIVDTLGELMPFIMHAEVVFMGGSLVPVGGHNIIEPAQHKRCILIGPHHENFKNIVQDLAAKDAIKIVQNARQLIEYAFALSNDEAKRSHM